jgi:predicted RNA-binding Zn-ribbon protein involved in translation (DUF1610 family)
MFFFVGGVQPRTVVLEKIPAVCPTCGRGRQVVKRTDSYFSLFFIPLIRVRKGDPFLQCEACGAVVGRPEEAFRPPAFSPRRCASCGRPLDADFNYCPSCGTPADR